MSVESTEKPKFSKHFFRREPNGMVKLRINLRPEEASMIEEAAGDLELMLWIHKALAARAKADVRAHRRARTTEPPDAD